MSFSITRVYNITSNRESGEERYDICLEPKDKNRRGILIEIKAVEKEAKKALNQIKEKDYIRDLRSRGIKEIICIGIAFSKKK